VKTLIIIAQAPAGFQP